MTGPGSKADLAAHAEAVSGEIFREACRRARAEAIDWLVPQLVQAYRQALSEQFGLDRPAVTGYYLYGIAEADRLGPIDGLAGIDDAIVLPISHERLSALVSPVQLASFHAAQQSTDLTESGWLARAVRAHEAVAEHGLGRIAVLPMRFGTVYSSPAAVSAVLAEHQSTLLAELHRLGTSTEWGLKVSLADTATPAEPAQRVTEVGRTGTGWLLERQSALSAKRRQRELATDHIEDIRTSMRGYAREVVMSTVNERDRAELVSLSFLVDDVKNFQAGFAAVRQQHSDSGLDLRMTGPWPPYHFVRLADLRGDDHG
jgi:gas vesicle protein GvpL/GvpF